MQADVKDLEADMSNAAGDPTTTFCLKEEEHASQGRLIEHQSTGGIVVVSHR